MDKSLYLKYIRKNFGLTTGQVAKAAHVSPRTVEGWEQGRPVSKSAYQLIRYFIQKKRMERIVRRVNRRMESMQPDLIRKGQKINKEVNGKD